MSRLFETTAINGMQLSNRFVRSATWEGLATTDGAVTPKLIETMADLARGGVGMIISGHAYIRPEGQATPWQLGAYKDELLPGLLSMTAAVHAHDSKIVLQLAHAGNCAVAGIGQAPWVVSNFDGLATAPRREMTVADIGEIVAGFAAAARRAKSAGFDGVQLHSAHGYLLSQFLSPAFNRRQDSYGGAIRNRARIHLEVLQAVRDAVGTDYPVLIKMNCRDFIENGLGIEESVQVAQLLAESGIDAIEVSGGTIASGKLSPSRIEINSDEREAYFRNDARAIKQQINVPVILVGGVRSFAVAEQVVAESWADYIALCRPLISEPDLIARWKRGDRRKAECKSDNRCFRPAFAGEGLYCLSHPQK